MVAVSPRTSFWLSVFLVVCGLIQLKVKNAIIAFLIGQYRGADKSLTRPEMKRATATEDLDVHMSYLLS
jgi:hypothetical protein